MKKGWPKGKKRSIETREKMRQGHYGLRQSKETIEKRVSKYRGAKNFNWKDDEAGYSAIHTWVRTNYGSPKMCEHCQKNNLIGHKIHWANKSHKYKRDREDWLRLCVKCHYIFDKKFNSKV